MFKNKKSAIIGFFIFVMGLSFLRTQLEHQVGLIFIISFFLGLVVSMMSFLWFPQKEKQRYAVSYALSDKKLLEHLSVTDLKKLKMIISDLSIRSDIPSPEIFVIVENKPTAYSYKFNLKQGVIKISTGLLNTYNQVTWRGILAHEISHLKNNDTWKGLFRVFLAVWVLSATFLVGLNLVSVLFPLIVFAEIYSFRKREYEADLFALKMTDNFSVLGYMIDTLNFNKDHKAFLKSDVGQSWKKKLSWKEKCLAILKLINYQVLVYGLDLFGTHPHWHKRIKNILIHQNVRLTESQTRQFISGLQFSKKFKGDRSLINFSAIELSKRERSILELGGGSRR